MPNLRCCSYRQWKKKTDSREINTSSYAWIREKLNMFRVHGVFEFAANSNAYTAIPLYGLL